MNIFFIFFLCFSDRQSTTNGACPSQFRTASVSVFVTGYRHQNYTHSGRHIIRFITCQDEQCDIQTTANRISWSSIRIMRFLYKNWLCDIRLEFQRHFIRGELVDSSILKPLIFNILYETLNFRSNINLALSQVAAGNLWKNLYKDS